MKFKCLLFAGLMLTVLTFRAAAERVEKPEAERLAVAFMSEQVQLYGSAYGLDVSVAEIIPREFNDITVYYAVNFSAGGYVILSADDVLKPIIGYAYQGAYSYKNRPCCFDEFMENRAKEAATVIIENLPATDDVAMEWELLRTGNLHQAMPETLADVQPLLMSPWNQDYPYNALCPPDPAGPGGHVYAGCVATAMAMIMYYYRYPEHGYGEKTHYSAYGPLYVNFGETYYDWDAMLNVVLASSGNSIPAVAELQYHCGVAVNMSYSPHGSGAQGHSIPGAVYNYFGYASTVNFTQRNSYTYSTWVNILKGQLDPGYPVYYQGYDGNSGHAWVCDGYEDQTNDTYFHMNWGWGGYGNGFFHLNNLNSGNGNFNSGHGIVRNFHPPTSAYPYYCDGETHVITSVRGTLEDGSGPVHNYQNNVNCTWLIAPTDSVSSITLNFLKFDTQPNDIVTIYDGESADDPVLGTFSGNTLPETITASGSKMLINFVTDNAGTAPGWFATFSSTLPVFCHGMVTTEEPSGTFSDGSGPYNYNHNSFCRWFLKPADASYITITFNEFDLEDENDYVQILQLPNNVLGTFSGNTIPPPVVSTSNEVMIIFRSNNFYNAQGFSAEWAVDNVGVKERETLTGLNVFPNPSSRIVNVSFSSETRQDVSMILYNQAGQEVYSETIQKLSGKCLRAIDVSNFPKGVYTLNILHDNASLSRKVIVE